MDRRKALFLTMLGSLAPRGLLAQSAKRRNVSTDSSQATKPRLAPMRSSRNADDNADTSSAPAAEDDGGPASIIPEPGQGWRNFDIAAYTALSPSQTAPQSAIVDWIFRRTGTSVWHGEKIAVLSASRTQIRAYHNAKILSQVQSIVERFTNATNDLLTVRVRFVTANDTRWRYAVYSRLTPVGTGPQGQQIWTLKSEDSAFVLAQMQVYQGFRLLTDKEVEMVNGQTLTVKRSAPLGFTGNLQRESAAELGYQPKTEQLEEGVTLRLSPLLTWEGDMVDAAIDLTANTVKNFHRTRVIAPREIGPSEMTIDVPEVTESRLSQTVKGWNLGQTLLISAGIQPGILGPKAGFMNLRIPGTYPTGTELLVFIEAKAVGRGGGNPPKSKTNSRERDDAYTGDREETTSRDRD